MESAGSLLRMQAAVDLKQRWLACCQALGREDRAGEGWQWLQAAYSGADRHYHNLAHIGDCLRELDEHAAGAEDPLALEVAIWFHDGIYDSQAKDNEARSAEAALAFLGGTVPAAFRKRVEELILATCHRDLPEIDDARLIADLDLAVLAWPPARYAAYAQAIRAEYAWVPLADFIRGRAQVLRHFLQRDFLYATPSYRQRCESMARKNLALELAALEAGDTLT